MIIFKSVFLKSKKQIYLVCALFSLTLTFGCSPQGTGILGSKSTFAEVIDKATANAPFAYDVAIDTISYNSCINYVSNTNVQTAIPGLRVGSSEGFISNSGNGVVKGGLKLRTEFLQYVGKNFSPESSSGTVTSAQIQRVLSQSPVNKLAFLQFSLRKKADLSLYVDLIAPGANNNISTLVPVPGRDAFVFAKDLASGFVGQSLVKDVQYTKTGDILTEGARVNSLSENSDPAAILASFGLNQTADATFTPPVPPVGTVDLEFALELGEYYADFVRKKFSTTTATDKIILTALFGGSAADDPSGAPPAPGTETISQLRRPPNTSATPDFSKAYGRGYALNFSSRAVTNVAGWTRNVLSGTAVVESDLSGLPGSAVTGTTWTCKNFVIVPSSKYNNPKSTDTNCSPLTSDDLAVGTRKSDTQLIRRQYAAADWDIGLFIPANTIYGGTVQDRKSIRKKFEICLSPKNATCYLPTSTLFLDNPSAAGVTEIPIQYDPTKECYLTAYRTMGVTYSSSPSEDQKRLLGRCAQYASICARNSSNF